MGTKVTSSKGILYNLNSSNRNWRVAEDNSQGAPSGQASTAKIQFDRILLKKTEDASENLCGSIAITMITIIKAGCMS